LGALAGFPSINKLQQTTAHKQAANPTRLRLVVVAKDNERQELMDISQG
jgi:hypothetical protein